MASALTDFESIAREFGRVAIAGGPRVGKSTLAGTVKDRKVFGTDAYRNLPWEEVPERLILDATPYDRFVLEGVQSARALRKGLQVDAVVYLGIPKVELQPRQAAMAKGVETVLREWRSSNPTFPFFREFTPGLFLRFPLALKP